MLTADDLMGLAEWLKKYGQLVAYTIAVVTLTVFLSDSNRAIKQIGMDVSNLSSKVDGLQTIAQDREKYERWLKQTNIRLKRLYNARGWDYEEIE